MKKTILVCIVFVFSLIFTSCSNTPAGPLSVIIDTPVTITETPTEIESVKDNVNQIFNYILVQETNKYYLHKLESWKILNGIITFDCPVCGNTIRIPEAKVIMYEKVNLKTAWSADANVCGGDTSNWHELLGK